MVKVETSNGMDTTMDVVITPKSPVQDEGWRVVSRRRRVTRSPVHSTGLAQVGYAVEESGDVGGNCNKIQKKFGSLWQWDFNYSHSPRGRIWLGWKHAVVTVQILQKTEQMIHTLVTAKSGQFSTYFTPVYGLHTIDTRKPLWVDLTNLGSVITDSWLVMGDFNSILYSDDRLNGSIVTATETRDFEACIDGAALAELKSCGHFYSWSNKGQGEFRISSRIDRAFGKASWNLSVTNAIVDYLNPGLSDHSPLLLSCNVNVCTGGRPFKFFNYMADHPNFLQTVQVGWSTRVWAKLKVVKQGLKHLHEKEFAKQEDIIDQIRTELSVVQTQLADNSSDEVLLWTGKECTEQLKKFLHMQESAYRQKSRI
ncbi:uncharacterized protein [Spinacia oleracea]|uniref:Endonuclease/exonuclease/phosphatase domain-containing protein n=1 Tax=Spinacia oleracea TaxID=3562 RepID=A0A9R0J516_SPIOL|nr:uncharacterized protein LOC110799653 [Spinacia oleracea]